MGDYRAYILGIDGHRFVWVSDFKTDYRDDSAALDAARQLSDKHDVEVWDGGRLVALLSPSESPPPLAPSVAPDSEQIAVEPLDSGKITVEPSDSGKIAVEPPEPASPSQFSKLVAALSLKK